MSLSFTNDDTAKQRSAGTNLRGLPRSPALRSSGVSSPALSVSLDAAFRGGGGGGGGGGTTRRRPGRVAGGGRDGHRRRSSVVIGLSGNVVLREELPSKKAVAPTQVRVDQRQPWLQGVHQEVMLLPEWEEVRCGVWWMRTDTEQEAHGVGVLSILLSSPPHGGVFFCFFVCFVFSRSCVLE